MIWATFMRCMSKTQQTGKTVKCGVKTLREALHKSAGNMINTSLVRAPQTNRGLQLSGGSVRRNGRPQLEPLGEGPAAAL